MVETATTEKEKNKLIKDMTPEELKEVELLCDRFRKDDYDFELFNRASKIISLFYGEKGLNHLFEEQGYLNLDDFWKYFIENKRERKEGNKTHLVCGGLHGTLMALRSGYWDAKHEEKFKAEIKKEIYSDLAEKFKKAGINIEL